MKDPIEKVARAAALAAALGAAEVVPEAKAAMTEESTTTTELYNQSEQVAQLQRAYAESVQKVKPETIRLAELERQIPPGLIHGPDDLSDELRDALLASLGETQALITELSERAAAIYAVTFEEVEFEDVQQYIAMLREAQREIDSALRNQPTVDYDGYPTPGPNTEKVLAALEKNLTQRE